MTAINEKNIVLFHYPGSLWAGKVTAYLTLRGIAYSECIQPGIMPRPDLTALNIHYRRIPVLAIGRDIYYDTILILEKLEQLLPGNTLGSRDPASRALEKMLEKWIETAVMPSVIGSLPPSFLDNEYLVKDRRQCWDTEISVEAQEEGRPQALADLRTHFAFLESLLSDDRHWVLATKNPTLADIHTAFALHWIVSIPGALPEDFFSNVFPKVFAYLNRYREILETMNARAPKPDSLTGADVAKLIMESDFAEPEGEVTSDPTLLRKGQRVALSRTDESAFSRSRNRDLGLLLALTPHEVVVGTEAMPNNPEIRLHAPRWGFSVERVL